MSELTINPIDSARQSVVDAFGQDERYFNLDADPTIDDRLFDEMNAAPHFDHDSLRVDTRRRVADALAEVRATPELADPLLFIPRASARIVHERDQYGLAA